MSVLLSESKIFRTRTFAMIPFCLVILTIQDPRSRAARQCWVLNPTSVSPGGALCITLSRCLLPTSTVLSGWGISLYHCLAAWDKFHKRPDERSVFLSLLSPPLSTARSHLILQTGRRMLLSTLRWTRDRTPNLGFKLTVWYLKVHNFLLVLHQDVNASDVRKVNNFVSFNTRRHFVILHMRNIYNKSVHRERDRVTAARARQEKNGWIMGKGCSLGQWNY